MLQIGVNHSQQVGISLRPTMNHCAREPALALSLKHPHTTIVRRAGAADFGGAIGAAIIYDDELTIYVRVNHGRAEPLQKNRNVS
jgi:hypothetical protein